MSLKLRQAIPGRPPRGGVRSLAGVVTSEGVFYVSRCGLLGPGIVMEGRGSGSWEGRGYKGVLMEGSGAEEKERAC